MARPDYLQLQTSKGIIQGIVKHGEIERHGTFGSKSFKCVGTTIWKTLWESSESIIVFKNRCKTFNLIK